MSTPRGIRSSAGAIASALWLAAAGVWLASSGACAREAIGRDGASSSASAAASAAGSASASAPASSSASAPLAATIHLRVPSMPSTLADSTAKPFATPSATPSAVIEVSGVSAQDLAALRTWEPNRDAWSDVLRIRIASGTDLPPVAGRYTIVDDTIRFTPLFPFEAGRRFEVTFDRARIAANDARAAAAARAATPGVAAPASGSRAANTTTDTTDTTDTAASTLITAIVGLPAAPAAPATTVVERVTPSGDRVPENLLRMYIHFSAPMGMRGGIEYLRLLDERGRDVVDPFLPVAAEFWNHDRTRYTLFLDPGRVKRGVGPNEQMGRSLEAGRTYTLVVDAAWRDAHHRPLAQPFRRTFRAGPAIAQPLDTAAWRVAAPSPGTRDPLVVTFPHALDRGLLQRALGIETSAGAPLSGEIRVDTDERRWLYVPRDPWRAGDYQLVVLTILEDPSGNRIGRAFETQESPAPSATRAPGAPASRATPAALAARAPRAAPATPATPGAARAASNVPPNATIGRPPTTAAARDDEPARVTRAFRIADPS